MIQRMPKRSLQPAIDDFELLSELGEDSELSELLGTTSNFHSSEDEGGESGGDRYLAAGIAQNEEIGSILNMTSNSDLDISAGGNWLEDAFGQKTSLCHRSTWSWTIRI